LLCLVYLLTVVVRIALKEEWPTSWCMVWLVSLASFYAIPLTFQGGQVNFMAVAAAAFARVWARERDLQGGAQILCAGAIFVATLIKTYPVLLLIVFLVRGDFKVLIWFFIFMAADALLAWLTVPREVWWSWIHDVMPTGRFGVPTFGLPARAGAWNQSLNGALSRMVSESMTATLGPFVRATVLGLAIAVCWTSRRSEQRGYYDLGFGMITVATFLIAPVSWFHHFVFLIPALCAFASVLNRSEYRGAIPWCIALLITTILISVRWPIVQSHPTHPLVDTIVMTVPILGPLALFGMFAILPFYIWRVRDRNL
jgi:hypothetical protein